MNYKNFSIFLITFSTIAHNNNDQKAFGFYQNIFVHGLINKELPDLQKRKEEIFRNMTNSDKKQDENISIWQKCAQQDVQAVIDERIEILIKAAKAVRKQLSKKYNVTASQIWWSQKLLQQAAEKVIAEQPNTFNQLIESEEQSFVSRLTQQLVDDVTVKFACGYGLEAGCKGMGNRRFLFGESVAYYLRFGQNRDPFEPSDK